MIRPSLPLLFISFSMIINNMVLWIEYFNIEEKLLEPVKLKSELISEHYFHSKVVSSIIFTNINFITILVYLLNCKKMFNSLNDNSKFCIFTMALFGILIYFPQKIWETFYVDNIYKFTKISLFFFFHQEFLKFILFSFIIASIINISHL